MSAKAANRPLGAEPLVSVVIPAFNVARYIAETIASVRAQTYRRLEIVVVDDGSSDATPEIVTALARQDSRIKLLRQANGGVARARNAGLAAAAGPLVAPVDADDLWAPTKVEKQVAVFLRGGTDLGLVYCWTQRIDDEGRIVKGNVLEHSDEGDVFTRLIQTNFIGHGSAPMMRRDLALEVGGYDPRLRDQGAEGCEDYRLYLLLAERYRFGVVPEHLVGYRRVEGSMSQNVMAMRRSHELMIGELRARHPELPDRLFRRASSLLTFWLVSRGGSPFAASGRRLLLKALWEDPTMLFHPWPYQGLFRLCNRRLMGTLANLSPALGRRLLREPPHFLPPEVTALARWEDQEREAVKLSSSTR